MSAPLRCFAFVLAETPVSGGLISAHVHERRGGPDDPPVAVLVVEHALDRAPALARWCSWGATWERVVPMAAC